MKNAEELVTVLCALQNEARDMWAKEDYGRCRLMADGWLGVFELIREGSHTEETQVFLNRANRTRGEMVQLDRSLAEKGVARGQA